MTTQHLKGSILNLDPGLAFGTGMHQRRYVLNGSVQTLLIPDGNGLWLWIRNFGVVGCLGASQITGLDIDPQALIATEHNASLNHLWLKHCYPIRRRTVLSGFVVANITSRTL